MFRSLDPSRFKYYRSIYQMIRKVQEMRSYVVQLIYFFEEVTNNSCVK
jgi:hypothetical protein